MSSFLQVKNDFLGVRGLKIGEETMRRKEELSVPMRPKIREMTQHGGQPGWLEESDPAG
jgi:hypothetical protein